MVNIIKKQFNIISALMIVAVFLVSLVYGFKKQGFYIDEFGSYTVANGTQLGIAITPGEWNDTSDYWSQLTSDGEENFSFRQTYDTAWTDVHPPLYFFMLHFVSSMFPGVFSKWIGLSINLVFLIPLMVLVKKIAWKLSGGNELITLLTMALVGLSPATISMVMMVRMYIVLAVWTLLYAYICVSDLERDRLSVTRFLIPVFLCGFLGFMTQYLYVVVMFFITFVYMFYLVFSCRRIKDAFIFGFTALVSLISTYFVWPISYYHIFKGYRGEDSFTKIIDISVFKSRLITHYSYMNRMVFGGLLPLFIIFLLAGVVLIIKRVFSLNREGQKPVLCALSYQTRAFIMLLISSILTFFVLVQVALLDELTSIRHYYSAYALFMLLAPIGIYRLVCFIAPKYMKAPIYATVVVVLTTIVLGFIGNKVLYLYENHKVTTEFAKVHPDMKVVMIENGLYDAATLQVMVYPRVYYIRAEEPSSIENDEIAKADELLVYVYKLDQKDDEYLDMIYRQNNSFATTEKIWEGNVFSAYYMH